VEIHIYESEKRRSECQNYYVTNVKNDEKAFVIGEENTEEVYFYGAVDLRPHESTFHMTHGMG